jgi:hypothetical protein
VPHSAHYDKHGQVLEANAQAYCRECRLALPLTYGPRRGRPRMYCSQRCRQSASARGAQWVLTQTPARRF